MSMLHGGSLVKQTEFIGLNAVKLLLYDVDIHDIVHTTPLGAFSASAYTNVL